MFDHSALLLGDTRKTLEKKARSTRSYIISTGQLLTCAYLSSAY